MNYRKIALAHYPPMGGILNGFLVRHPAKIALKLHPVRSLIALMGALCICIGGLICLPVAFFLAQQGLFQTGDSIVSLGPLTLASRPKLWSLVVALMVTGILLVAIGLRLNSER
jgi:hypothetical protein